MDEIKLHVFSAAQSCWTLLRSAGRAVLGEERFDRVVGWTRIREIKARLWLSRRPLPDGNVIYFRPQDQCIVEEVYEGGVYSLEDLEAGQTVVDAGAHIGAFALMAARRVGPEGRVIAFEPAPPTFELLCRNIAVNGLAWVRARNFALAEAEGEAELFMADAARDNHAADTLSAAAGRKAVPVRLRRLDDALAEEVMNEVDLLKIDVEGAELRALAGATATLSRTRRIVMEIHPPRVSVDQVRAILEPAGFSCRLIPASGESPILEARRMRP